MQALVDEQRRQATDQGLPEDLEAWERYAMQEVLGARSDHLPGIGSVVPRGSAINAQRIDDSRASSSASQGPPGVLISMSSFLGELLENLQAASIPGMQIPVLPPDVAQMVSQFCPSTQPGSSAASQQTPTQARMHSPQTSSQTIPEPPSVIRPTQTTPDPPSVTRPAQKVKGKTTTKGSSKGKGSGARRGAGPGGGRPGGSET